MKHFPHSLLTVALATSAIITVAPAGTLVDGGGLWKVRQVNADFAPASAIEALAILGGFGAQGERSVAVPTIDFGAGGEFVFDEPFPGLINGENQWAVSATGQILVNSAGDISFGIHADDWARLSIDGAVVVESTGNGVTSIGSVNLSAGLHDVELLHYEGSGGEILEAFVATQNGAFTTFAEAIWELLEVVSDPSPTAVNVIGASYPGNAVQGAVAAVLEATGGGGGPHRYELVYPLDPAGPFEVIAAGSFWRYLDDGTLPPADWTSGAFDDSLWDGPGAAPLGYGDADILSVMDFGPDANNKFPAYYLRNSFTIPAGDLPLVDKLRLRMRRDDGAIVYINGVEVLRDNLPAGAVDNTTLADVVTGGAAEGVYYVHELDSSALVEGANTIAVELHQASGTSSDVILDLSLEYDRRSSIAGDEQYFEISGNQLRLADDAASIPATSGQTLELSVRARNSCDTSIVHSFDVTVAPASSNAPTAIAIDNASVNETVPVGTLVGTLSAADADAGDLHSFELRTPLAFFPDNGSFTIVGDQLFTAVPLDVDAQSTYQLQIRATDPVGLGLNGSVQITVDPAPALISLSPDSVPENAPEFIAIGALDTIDPLSGSHSYRLLAALDPVPQQLISFGDPWRYLDDGSDPGSAWTERLFDDSGWFPGTAPLGYGDHNGAAPVTGVGFGPDANNKYPTTHFRTTFEIDVPALVESLSLDLAVDDGAIIHINGQEVFRVRADGVDSFDDYTGQADGGEDTNDVFTLSGALPELLIGGTNVIAVEVHQTSGTSSDIWLDLSMQANLRVGGDDEEHFYIAGNQLFLNKEVAEIPAFDGDSFALTVESTNEFGAIVTEEVIVNVGPASANPPTDITLSNTVIDERLPAGTVVGTLGTVDLDGGAFVYSLDPDASYPDNAQFDVLGDQLITRVPLDFDDGATRTIRITTTDNTGFTYDEEFVITLNFVEAPPTDITLNPDTFDFTDPPGTVIGTLDAVDENGGESHTFAFGTWPDVPGSPVVPFGSVWKYLDDGSDQGVAWFGTAFDDGAWQSGPGQLGYGDGDEATVVGFIDTDPVTAGDQKNATTYFRHTVNIPAPSPDGYEVRVLVDDAFALHVNGNAYELRMTNLPAFPALVPFNAFASATTPDNTILTATIPPGVIVAGDNTLAVEIHQANDTSSDISFDLQLSPLVPSPYPGYFEIVGDQLRTTVDFTQVAMPPPPTFQVPVVATDPLGNSVEVLVTVNMTGGSGDSDGDGLADGWEILYFGDLSQDASGDSDGDGVDNGAEFGADTDPTDPADFLQITRIDVNLDGADIFWDGRPDRIYTLYRSPDLSEGSWTIIEAGLTTGVPAELSATDPEAETPGQFFYRIEARAPLP